MATSPTARSLAFLRRNGWCAAVVEKWLPQANLRQDVWGFGDVLAAHPGDRVVMLVQVTTIDHVAHRLTKARSKPELAAWLRAGGVFEIHGWVCRGGRWQVKRVAVQSEDLGDVVIEAPQRRWRLRKGERQGGLFDQLLVDVPADAPAVAADVPSTPRTSGSAKLIRTPASE